jgi:hypothetical protein
MRTFWIITAFLSTVLSSMGAIFPTLYNSGPLTIKLTTMQQGLDDATVISKTNTTGTGTTVTTVSKSTVSNSVIQAADLLAMLENSFATTFPAGSKLIVSRHGDFLIPWVVDSTGTNIIFNLSTNFTIGTIPDARVHVDSQTVTSKSGGSGDSVSGALAETVTEIVDVHYDDTGLVTQDGTHTSFYITCQLVRKSSENLATQQIKDNVKIQGSGNGTVRDQTMILELTTSANISGVMDPP